MTSTSRCVNSSQILGEDFVFDFFGDLACGKNKGEVGIFVGDVDAAGGVQPDAFYVLEVGDLVREDGFEGEGIFFVAGGAEAGDATGGVEEEEMPLMVRGEIGGIV